MEYGHFIFLLLILGLTLIGVSLFFEWKIKQGEQESIDKERTGVNYDEVNQKINDLSEYSNYLQKSLDDKQKELVFLYNMLENKQKEISLSLEGRIEDSKAKVVNVQVDKTGEDEQEGLLDIDEKNMQILNLIKEGLKEDEIAKRLGIGIGEVRLVLNLFT